jgi:hypothetical protein
MINRLSFGVVILALSMACTRSSPTSPTPVAAPPAPPAASTPKVVALTITASRDVLFVNQIAVLTANAQYDDGTSAPITPTWESSSGVVTLNTNGPVALATSQGVGTAVIMARAAGLSATQSVTVNPGAPPPPR